jgi:hypothetical protein
MQSLNEAEMHDIYAEGFSEFTLTNISGDDYTMKLWLNINTAQFTEIDTLKMGWHDYRNLGTDQWDQDWSNVQIGDGINSADNFVTQGFYFEAEFEDFSQDYRVLKSVTYGVDYAKGRIHGDFDSFSGTLNSGDYTNYNGAANGWNYIGVNEDNAGGGIRLTLNADLTSPYVGFWMHFDNADHY